MNDKHRHQAIRRSALKVVVTCVAVNFKALAIPGGNQKEVKEKMKTTVIVSFEVKNDKVIAFTEILNSVKIGLPKIKGCIGVNIFKNSTIANKFTLVETWESEELHQDHISHLSKDGTWDMITSHLSKDPESDYFLQL